MAAIGDVQECEGAMVVVELDPFDLVAEDDCGRGLAHDGEPGQHFILV